MHTMKSTAPRDRVAKLWSKDPERLPAHVQRAMTVPPSGRADIPLSQYGKRPCTDGVFMDKIPSSAADVDEYINNARFPYTKRKAPVIKAMSKLSSDEFVESCLISYILLLMALCIVNAFVWQSLALMFINLLLIGPFLVVFERYDTHKPILPSMSKGKRVGTKPTKRMRAIEKQSVDVSKLRSQIPERAWNIYLYDREHYDKFVSLCENMLKVEDEHCSETRETKREIIDTFYEMSLMRQEETKRAIDTSLAELESIRRKEEDRVQQMRDDADKAQADALSEMMLEPLQADLRVMKAVYDKEVNA